MATKRPIIGITIGDPAGIGPEIIVKSLANKGVYKRCQPLVIGDARVVQQAINITDKNLSLRMINTPKEGKYKFGIIDLIDINNIDIENLNFGEIQKQCGIAAFQYIKTAVNFAKQKQIQAIATAPINKEALQLADIPHIGHTEMLGYLTKTHDPLTMFQVRNMRIFFLTRHVSLKEAISQINKKHIHSYLKRCDKALRRMGLSSRKIAVAGLNPHGGEDGLFGYEEIDEIIPAIDAAKQDRINAYGPIPADSVFHQTLNGKFDAVLSLYHDQGHIAAKMTDFYRTVSITNGLPFLRTSVDHGTAFDIAGKNIASSLSMEECIKLAAEYAPKFNQYTL